MRTYKEILVENELYKKIIDKQTKTLQNLLEYTKDMKLTLERWKRHDTDINESLQIDNAQLGK